MSGGYEVGYRKPPKHTRFKEGRSGNPKGRPKGTRNLKTDLAEELQERILLREGGREIRITKQRAMVKSQLAKAIKGDTRASTLMLDLVLRLLELDMVDRDDGRLTDDEKAIIGLLEERLGQAGRASGNAAPEGNDPEEPGPDGTAAAGKDS